MRWIMCTMLLLAAAASAAGLETTFVFQQEGRIAGRTYYGATDFTKQHYTAQPFEWSPGDLRWYAYGPAPLGETYQIRRLITTFDTGALPRGTVTKATLTYTIHFDADVDKPAWCRVFATQAPYLTDGDEIASGEIPAGKAGEDTSVQFDVTDYVAACGASAAFELRSAHDRYLVSVWTSGKWGPWARAKELPLGTREFFPKLEVTVSSTEVPQPPVPSFVAVGDKAFFGGAAGAVCSFASKPEKSNLSDADITGNAFTPDAAGEYIVQTQSSGVTQYSQVVARPIRAAHPRLSIDAAVIARLKAAAADANAGWLKVKSAADDLLAKPGVDRGYAGFGYRDAVDKLSLAYLVTADRRYATKAIEVMDVACNDGLVLVSSDAGYCIRAYGPAIAIGYDRLYDVLTDEQKSKYWHDLNYWLAWYAAAGYQKSGPAMGNYFSGYFSALYVTAYATYGDNPRAPELLGEAERFFQSMIASEADGGVLEGGDDPEGRYAGLYFETYFNYLLTRKMCGDTSIERFDWPRQVALCYIHRTRPDEKTFYDYGAWRDQEPSWVTPGPMVALSALLAGSREGEYAQYYAAKYGDVAFSTLFDPSRKSSYWDDQPLSYFSSGLSLATARSSWAGDACWVSMQGGGRLFCDHQHRDFGHFELFRGADELLADANTDDGGVGSEWHNCLLIDVPKTVNNYTPGQHGWAKDTVTKFEDASGHAVMTTDLAKSYMDTNSQAQLFKRYSRTLAYMRPGVLLLVDSFETASPEWPAYGRLNFGAMPEIQGSVITAVNGKSRVTATFFGSSVNIEPVTGDKRLANSLNYRPLDQDGPVTVVVVFAATGADEAAPGVSASIDGGTVVIKAGSESLSLSIPADQTH